MNALLLTVFVGAVLVLFFVVLFLLQTSRGSERDALLPLAPERAIPQVPPPSLVPPAPAGATPAPPAS